MYTPKEISISEVREGVTYDIHGDLDPCGHDTVVRKVIRVREKNILCECGRKFIINNNLHVYEWWGRQH